MQFSLSVASENILISYKSGLFHPHARPNLKCSAVVNC